MKTETLCLRLDSTVKQLLKLLSEQEKRSITKEIEFLVIECAKSKGLWSKVLKPQAEKFK